MDEYIDRNEVLKILTRYSTISGSTLGRHSGTVDIAMEAIEMIPVADVVPIVRGKWIFGKDLPEHIGSHPKNKWHLFCSCCHHQALNLTIDNDYTQDVETDFCPFCGADLRGDE